MIPDPEAMRVPLEIGCEPIGGFESSLEAHGFCSCGFGHCVGGRCGFWHCVSGFAKTVVVRESPLRDGDRVVLPADRAAIIENRNSVFVVRAGVVGLLAKRHVIRTESPTSRLHNGLRTDV